MNLRKCDMSQLVACCAPTTADCSRPVPLPACHADGSWSGALPAFAVFSVPTVLTVSMLCTDCSQGDFLPIMVGACMHTAAMPIHSLRARLTNS